MSTTTKTFALRLLQYTPAAKRALWQWKFDIILLVASATCFGLFLQRSLRLEQLSGIGGPIALLTHGSAERKASGTHVFVNIGPNSNLFNLDAIWVGRDKEATILLEDSLSITLTEKTLMILKRPFKHIPGQSSLDEEIKVVKGKVKASSGKVITPEVEVLPPIILDPPSNDEKKIPIQLYPKDNSVLYLRPEKDIPLIFAWPTNLTGYIVIQNKNNGRRIYSDIHNQRSFSTSLDQPGSFFWEIIDEDRRPMLGPFTFIIKHLDEETARQLLKSRPSANTEVYW